MMSGYIRVAGNGGDSARQRKNHRRRKEGDCRLQRQWRFSCFYPIPARIAADRWVQEN